MPPVRSWRWHVMSAPMVTPSAPCSASGSRPAPPARQWWPGSGHHSSSRPISHSCPSDLLVDPGEFPKAPETMVVFDAGSPDRLAEFGGPAGNAGTLVVIDHHVTNEGFGDIPLVDPDAAATGVIVVDLLDALGWPITPEIATCLLTAVVTDTGRFQYANTTAPTLEVAARPGRGRGPTRADQPEGLRGSAFRVSEGGRRRPDPSRPRYRSGHGLHHHHPPGSRRSGCGLGRHRQPDEHPADWPRRPMWRCWQKSTKTVT